MLHLLQNNIFGEENYPKILSALQEEGCEYKIIKIIPFTDNIVDENDQELNLKTKNVFCWGSVKMAQIIKKRKWNPGSLHNSNHDFRIYSKFYGKEMLNWDSQIIKFGDEFKEPGYIFFARPCEDTKTFSGQEFIKESWDQFVKDSLSNGHTTTLNGGTPVQISSRKNITQEFRFWIVGGKIITYSQYRNNGRTIISSIVNLESIEYVNKMIKIYQPASSFVMDVALSDGSYKIIEINCINCSGFYNADLKSLVRSINLKYSTE